MKTIVNIGTGYSGSSAIYDFLKKTNKFYDPFSNVEFSIVYDPGGIIDIENCIKNNFTPNKCNIIYQQFIKNISFYTNSASGIIQGKNMNVQNENISALLNEYLKSIVDIEYQGQSSYLKFNQSFYKKLISKLLFKLKRKANNKMILFCDIKKFEDETSKFFEKLLNYNNTEKKNIILDQGGSLWNPFSSTKYFPNPLCIITLRDPRDIFSEFKTKAAFSYPGNDVNIFCKWYKKIILNINNHELKKENILKIYFEDFIYDNKKILEKISNYFNLEIKLESNDFDFSRSKKNIKRYKDNLLKFEIETIEKKLKDYLFK